MTNEQRKVPELRFKEFSDDWEQRKLNQIVERITRKNHNNINNLPLTISAQDGLVDQKKYFNKQVASRSLSNYYLINKGEFAYNKSYSNGYPYGAIKRLENYNQGVVSTLYIVFKATNIPQDFLATYFESDKWFKEIAKISAEGARNHGLLNISTLDFFNIEIYEPINDKEKDSISELIMTINKIIDLHQRKNMIVKKLISSYSLLLFNFEDETKLRYKNSEGKINNFKLSALLNQRNEKSTESEEYPLMSFVGNLGIVAKGERYDRSALVKDSKSKIYSRTEYNDFIYSSNNFETGSIGRNNYGSASISPVYSIFEISNEVDINYIHFRLLQYDIINSMKRFRQGVVYGQWKVHEKDFLAININLPNFSDQMFVGKYLITLENIRQYNISKLKNLLVVKKSFLRKMFVNN